MTFLWAFTSIFFIFFCRFNVVDLSGEKPVCCLFRRYVCGFELVALLRYNWGIIVMGNLIDRRYGLLWLNHNVGKILVVFCEGRSWGLKMHELALWNLHILSCVNTSKLLTSTITHLTSGFLKQHFNFTQILEKSLSSHHQIANRKGQRSIVNRILHFEPKSWITLKIQTTEKNAEQFQSHFAKIVAIK